MKKILVIIAIIVVVMIYDKSEDTIVIPNNAIRFRVVANSNTIEDQKIKNDIAKDIESYVIDLTKNAKSSAEAKNILLRNYNNIKNNVDNYMNINNIDMNFDLSIGRNYFPSKIYRGIKYDEGYYDSVVLTLGKKQGMNWWCVMYPPLCLLDRENMNNNEIEFTTLVKELLNNYNMYID